MSPEELREAIVAAQYGDEELPAEVAEQIRQDPQAQAYLCEMKEVDALLNLDEDQPPRPGFDTRFFARLEEQKTQAAASPLDSLWTRLRWLFAPLLVAGAAAALVLVIKPEKSNPIMDPDLALAMDLEIVEDLEVLSHFDELESFELLAQLDISDLDDVDGEASEKVRVQ